MRVAVVGASGNVGTGVLTKLHHDPTVDEVVGIARRPPPPGTGPLHDKVRWIAADISRDELAGHLAGCDVVVHLAWLIQPSHQPQVLRRVNVYGSLRVFRAAVDAGASAIVYASSIGVYSPGPRDHGVDESWARDGIATSQYSVEKAEVERMLDGFEREFPALRIVRLRPGLIFHRAAASEIARYFAGPLLPTPLLAPGRLPLLPVPPGLVLQVVHNDDMAEAYRLAIVGDVRGAFNVAADPVLDAERLGQLLEARPVTVPARVLRTGAKAAWRLRVVPAHEGWLDMGLQAPLMDTSRARAELGWNPVHSSEEALLELLEGMRVRAGGETPVLAPMRSLPKRVAHTFRKRSAGGT